MSASYQYGYVKTGILGCEYRELRQFAEILAACLVQNGKELVETHILADSLIDAALEASISDADIDLQEETA